MPMLRHAIVTPYVRCTLYEEYSDDFVPDADIAARNITVNDQLAELNQQILHLNSTVSSLDADIAARNITVNDQLAELNQQILNLNSTVSSLVLPNYVTRSGAVYYCLWWYAG
ncbi:hypothetical protein CAPTEDRAFT_208554 [Capitella teleta]|uniref:Uncharacterized protein n=1 Tax=Capitella teleta TaxID=283909 RepID=R7V678_CAPTE|nr:hypothetical protein CAPTEDRAFT_208554 [Capitella teleta]|eukprot:ELU11250.1 hypothetical protein CAPTEDRAFT_208554 [Capitella teleta]